MSSTSSLASTPSPFPTKSITNLRISRYSNSNLSFRLSPNPILLPFFNQGPAPNEVLYPRVKAHLNEDPNPSTQLSSGVLATEQSISHFISQVATLVKLVDSRDIVELHLKQLDIEVTIRKKEAIPQPAIVYSSPSVVAPPLTPSSTSTHSPAPPARAPSSTSPPAAKSAKSSHPPLKSPMAGTFYKCPAPGEPAFVKVGDKVKKGQVLCIIEAMKLMNEIEADQSGTIVDILAEDGKPVSVDTPLFVIEP